ncbi:MAG TPA: YcxB family protein [Ferruginibacter sp.]|nr:YcxB family protein [Ferruginibacter sp.]
MKLTYSLSENDFLLHQLYIASKNDRIKQQRLKSWLIYTAALLILSLLFYQSGNTFMTNYFLIFGLVILCFFPFYQKWYHKNHYKKYIADTYKNRFGQTTNVSLNEEGIETSDATGESKINLSEIENTIETSDYFYIKMRTGGHLIIPKFKLADTDSVRQELKKLCSKLSVDYIDDLNWRWK